MIFHSGFARLIVDDGRERTELDLGSDARPFPVEQGPDFPLLSGEELAVDKVLAVFGRAEARDFVYLLAVADRYGVDRLLPAMTRFVKGDFLVELIGCYSNRSLTSVLEALVRAA